MFVFLSKGGVLVIPILFCSVVALAIFLERVIRFAHMRKRGRGLEHKVAEKLTSDNDRDAMEIAGASDSPMGRVLVQGGSLAFWSHPDSGSMDLGRSP